MTIAYRSQCKCDTATSDVGGPLPTFVVSLPAFVGNAGAGPITSFTSSSGNILDVFLLPFDLPGFDVIEVDTSSGTNNYVIGAGDLQKTGTYAASPSQFVTPSFAGSITITQSSATPEPSTALLLGVPAALLLFRRSLKKR